MQRDPGLLKQTYRRVFPQKIRQKIWDFRTDAGSRLTQIAAFLLNVLPASLRVFFKNHASVIKKMDYANGDVYLDLSSTFEKKVRLKSCAKEPETVQWIEEFFKQGDVFYDIGANVGAYSLVAASFLKGQVTVYSFEPSFMNFSQLNKNIAVNHFDESIIPLNMALSDTTGIAHFYYQNFEPGGALHTLKRDAADNGRFFSSVYKQSVMAYRLDDLVEQFNLPLANHIKLDVDGIELEILRGARKVLEDTALKSILVEIGKDNQDIISVLEGYGFIIHFRPVTTNGLDNYIFLRN